MPPTDTTPPYAFEPRTDPDWSTSSGSPPPTTPDTDVTTETTLVPVHGGRARPRYYEWRPYSQCPNCDRYAYRRVSRPAAATEYRRCSNCEYRVDVPDDEFAFVDTDSTLGDLQTLLIVAGVAAVALAALFALGVI